MMYLEMFLSGRSNKIATTRRTRISSQRSVRPQMFVDSFKYYKAKSVLPNFNDVIDVNHLIPGDTGQLVCSPILLSTCIPSPPTLTESNTWRAFHFPKHPGLILIQNPFTSRGQRYWIARCLRDLPKAPNANNLNAHLFTNEAINDWWLALQQNRNDISRHDEFRRLKVSMRWATLGYQHNWDTKMYSDDKHSEMPLDIQALSAYFAKALGFGHFDAQAAIVNYYPLGTTLAGHTDHSEQNHMAPLFSFSFGQTAIFLIGGRTKAERPIALYLRSGDVLIMSAESRLCYHAVPRVMKETRPEPWNELVTSDTINNIVSNAITKKIRIDVVNMKVPILNKYDMNTELFEQVADEAFWLPYREYLNEARINLNVRQVRERHPENISIQKDCS